MKYLFLFVLAFILIVGNNKGRSAPGSAYILTTDTVPNGVPQLFGGKYYQFKGYVLIDSLLLMPCADTNFIPNKPALVYKCSDSTFYLWARNRWKGVLRQGDVQNVDTTSLSNRINQKLNISDTSGMLANYIRVTGFGILKTGQTIRADTSRSGGLPSKFYVDSLVANTVNAITQLTGDVTAGPGSGSQAATIATSAVTTTKIADNNVTNAKIVAFSPFPAERSYGKIYEKSFWNNVNEDLQVGPSGNNTTAVSNGFITMTATGFNAANIIRIISDRPSCLNKSKLTTQIGIGTLGANAADIGSMIYSTITHSGAQFGYMGFIQTSTSGTSTVFIYDQARASQKATATGFTYASNDIVQFTWDLRDTVLSFTAWNMTSDPTGVNAKTATYNFAPNSSAHILPNSYNWAVYDGSGTGGTTRTLRYVKIESADTQYPNLLILGNSKTKIGYATFWNGRFGMQLNATYPNTLINAGGAERMLDMIARLDEITQLTPSQVLLADIASNSLRAGVSITDAITQYEYIVSRLTGAGIRVLHCVLPEDSTGGGLGQTAWNAWLSARYASTYINTYGAMSTNNIGNPLYLNADKIHLTQAGNDIITSTVISSGLVETISAQRRASYRTHDRWIVTTGDSTHFSKKIFAKDNNVPRWDFRNQSLTTSMLYMDSIKFIMSTSGRPALPISTLLGSFEGSVGAHGTAGAFITYGRDNSAQSYSPYVNSNTAYILRNATEVGYIGADGRTRIGNGPGTQSSNMPSMLQVRGTFTFSSALPLHGFLGSFDTSTISISSSGALNDMSAVSIAKPTITTSGAANSNIVQTFRIAGAPINGTNFLGIRRYALRVEADTSRIDGQVVLNNTPTAFGAYKILTKSPNGSNDTVITQIDASTFATNSALNDTAAAIRSAINSLTITVSTYSPTLTNGTNVDATSFPGSVYYQRIGNQVTVWGTISVDVTAATTATQFHMTLPVASALSASPQLSGMINSGITDGGYGFIAGDTVNDRATIDFISGGVTSSASYSFRFSYEVL